MRYLGPLNRCCPTWMISAPCPWKAENFGLCGRPSFCRTRFWSDGMAMLSSWWCHSLCAASCSLTPMPAHSQPIWARNECWRNYVAFTTGPACVRTLMPGADNVKDVPLAGGCQVDLMATFARSPLVHHWTLSPLTSCLAYLPQPMATSTSLSPLTTSPTGLRQYPCATQRHQRACVHFTANHLIDICVA